MNWEIQKSFINLVVHGFITMFWFIPLAGVSVSGNNGILNYILFVFCAFGGIMQLLVFVAHMDDLSEAMKKYEETLKKEKRNED